MQWIAPSEKDLANDTLEKRLWGAADQLRANNVTSTARATCSAATGLEVAARFAAKLQQSRAAVWCEE